MGDFKPLLKLGPMSALQRCIHIFKSAGIETVLVVSGHQQEEIASVIAASQATQIINPQYKEGMFSSISCGIETLQGSCDAFFILPVDIPLVRPATVRELLLKFVRFEPLICYPLFDNRRGHPPLISSRLIPDILSWRGHGGLAGFLRRMEHRAMDVPVADQMILKDMDRPSDYHNFQKRVECFERPTEKECRALLGSVNSVPENIRAHCKMVARVARGLGEALLNAGLALDVDLLESAAAVHDLARGQRDHAQAGARMLSWWGFDQAADLVAAHMDLKTEPDDLLDEKQVLYLADKLVSEDRLVDMDERFRMKLEQYGHNPNAAYRIRTRRQTADTIRKRIESATGLPLGRILISIFQSQ